VTEDTFLAISPDQDNAVKEEACMNRLFSLFLFAAVLYQLIRANHAAHQALVPEPVARNRPDEAKEIR
jgi:hypothetical protein